MIDQKVLEKTKKHLMLTGGLHVQTPKSKKGNLSFKDIIPYHNEMIKQVNKLDKVRDINESIETCGKIILLAIELDCINSMFTGKEIKSYIGFEFGQDYISDVKPHISNIIDNIHFMLYDENHPLLYIPMVINHTSSFLLTLLKVAGLHCEDIIKGLNDVLLVILKHKFTKLHMNIKTAQWWVAVDYLRVIGLKPTTENAEAYLQYRDVKIDGEIQCRYWGEPLQEDEKFTEIVMRPKTTSLEAAMRVYQIRGSRDFDDKEYYTVMRVNEMKNAVDIIDGPLTKLIGINL